MDMCLFYLNCFEFRCSIAIIINISFNSLAINSTLVRALNSELYNKDSMKEPGFVAIDPLMATIKRGSLNFREIDILKTYYFRVNIS